VQQLQAAENHPMTEIVKEEVQSIVQPLLLGSTKAFAAGWIPWWYKAGKAESEAKRQQTLSVWYMNEPGPRIGASESLGINLIYAMDLNALWELRSMYSQCSCSNVFRVSGFHFIARVDFALRHAQCHLQGVSHCTLFRWEYLAKGHIC
jgi:hypothetical protein